MYTSYKDDLEVDCFCLHVIVIILTDVSSLIFLLHQ